MPPPANKLSPSLEDYLEAVLDLVREGQVARVRDIARRLGVGMSSVTVALRQLSARGLVNYDPYQVITLTEAGRSAGEDVERRHQVLQAFLVDVLGLDEQTARTNACRMEHAVDAQVLDRLEALAERLKHCPDVRPEHCLPAAGSRRRVGRCRATSEETDAAV